MNLLFKFTALASIPFLLSACVVGEAANALLHAGSGTFERKNRQRHLERVVRDWCLTLRASQIIPCYPLREDVEPGSMTVVNYTIPEMKRYWNQKGYLPFEIDYDHITSLDFRGWYRDSFGTGGNKNPYHTWREGWSSAPYAGFLSHSYTISRGESFSGALPLKGVPTMLSALNSRTAQVSVTLKKCHTVGIGETRLREAVGRWVDVVDNRIHLYNKLREASGAKRYMRIVSRVYLVEQVSVSVTDLSASSARLSAGEPKPAGNIFVAQGEAAGNFDKASSSLPAHNLTPQEIPDLPPDLPAPPAPAAGNSAPSVPGTELFPPTLSEEERLRNLRQELALRTHELKLEKARLQIEKAAMTNRFGGAVTPGATSQVASASKGSVTMEETFDRPLVIGFEAMDYEIILNGRPGEATLNPYAGKNTFPLINK